MRRDLRIRKFDSGLRFGSARVAVRGLIVASSGYKKARVTRAPSLSYRERQMYQLVPLHEMINHAQSGEHDLIFFGVLNAGFACAAR
jgi:hypothetical protein